MPVRLLLPKRNSHLALPCRALLQMVDEVPEGACWNGCPPNFTVLYSPRFPIAEVNEGVNEGKGGSDAGSCRVAPGWQSALPDRRLRIFLWAASLPCSSSCCCCGWPTSPSRPTSSALRHASRRSQCQNFHCAQAGMCNGAFDTSLVCLNFTIST